MFTKQWYPKAAKQLFFYPINAITPFYNTQQYYSSIQRVSITKFISEQLCNKCAIVHEEPGYPSNWSHTGVIFPLVAHWVATHIIKLVSS